MSFYKIKVLQGNGKKPNNIIPMTNVFKMGEIKVIGLLI